ncbi:hypothetical protein DTL21_09000 [Bremerella cremea]|uniref:DUF805 domain-containing protein n=1 Tax=Blastopirellula marina TaxID=124 RepID=A0A2S8FV72_9BACT|nr:MULTISPECIES: hypothetical protein [Pirellulaceae]PQO36053.1 hypothetical protein C5Y83_08995 [Blastopirellula marina]RCS48730.1 hypothetical protein DTL21_09000 [Bremerella cremea]
MTRLIATLDLLFGLRRPVSQFQYVAIGLALATFKYVIEATAVFYVAGKYYSPLEFLSPILTYRAVDFQGHDLLGWAVFLWTLPFVWIALTMSVRRAIDTHSISPWWALLVLLPIANFFLIFILCVTWAEEVRPDPPGAIPGEDSTTGELRVIVCILGGFGVGVVMMVTSVLCMQSYGAGLFVGSPVVMGAVAAYLYNYSQRQSLWISACLGAVVVGCGIMALLLFALEGIICLVMALPLALPLGIFGGMLGFVIAEATRNDSQWPHISAIVVCLPLLAGIESMFTQPHETVVMTAVEINASPDQVWDTVLAFPEIDAPQPWYFQLGIASPMRARIVGHGAGAVRHCEFTTGEFVEPITTWAPPQRLAFDVTKQPDPLVELSPYRNVHPPHLAGYMKCNRGEFRLIELANGHTRLEGRTWYELRMFPQGYWMLWSDLIIHQIHLRVLEHIQREAQR